MTGLMSKTEHTVLFFALKILKQKAKKSYFVITINQTNPDDRTLPWVRNFFFLRCRCNKTKMGLWHQLYGGGSGQPPHFVQYFEPNKNTRHYFEQIAIIVGFFERTRKQIGGKKRSKDESEQQQEKMEPRGGLRKIPNSNSCDSDDKRRRFGTMIKNDRPK